jgi:hypothetical protein
VCESLHRDFLTETSTTSTIANINIHPALHAREKPEAINFLQLYNIYTKLPTALGIVLQKKHNRRNSHRLIIITDWHKNLDIILHWKYIFLHSLLNTYTTFKLWRWKWIHFHHKIQHFLFLIYKGWTIKLALAPRPLMTYCASPLAAAMIITVAALRIVLAHGSKPT